MKTPTQHYHDSRYASAWDHDQSGPAQPRMHPKDRLVMWACTIALLAFALIMATEARAQPVPAGTTVTTTGLHIVAHGISHHVAQRQGDLEWNERNAGLGLRYAASDTWALQAGAYQNSIHRTSAYLFLDYTPVHLGSVHAGAFVGAVNGYKANDGGARLAGGALVRWQPGRFGLALRAVPRGSQDGSPVVSLEASWKL